MNKGELVDVLEGRLGSRRAASEAVEVLVDTIVRTVARGERVAISGFGTFERADRAPRTGRNPRTGEAVPIQQTSVPRFKPGTAFRSYVAEPASLPEADGDAGPVLTRAITTRGAGEARRAGASGRAPRSRVAAAGEATVAGVAATAVAGVDDAPLPAPGVTAPGTDGGEPEASSFGRGDEGPTPETARLDAPATDGAQDTAQDTAEKAKGGKKAKASKDGGKAGKDGKAGKEGKEGKAKKGKEAKDGKDAKGKGAKGKAKKDA